MQRLGPPHWPAYPPGAAYGALYDRDRARRPRGRAPGGAADRGTTCCALGIDVDCLPVADVAGRRAPIAVIGDRAYGQTPGQGRGARRRDRGGLAGGRACCRCSSTCPGTAAPTPTAITSLRWSMTDRATPGRHRFRGVPAAFRLAARHDRPCCVHRHRPGRAGHHFGDNGPRRDSRRDRISRGADERRYFDGRVVGLAVASARAPRSRRAAMSSCTAMAIAGDGGGGGGGAGAGGRGGARAEAALGAARPARAIRPRCGARSRFETLHGAMQPRRE